MRVARAQEPPWDTPPARGLKGKAKWVARSSAFRSLGPSVPRCSGSRVSPGYFRVTRFSRERMISRS